MSEEKESDNIATTWLDIKPSKELQEGFVAHYVDTLIANIESKENTPKEAVIFLTFLRELLIAKGNEALSNQDENLKAIAELEDSIKVKVKERLRGIFNLRNGFETVEVKTPNAFEVERDYPELSPVLNDSFVAVLTYGEHKIAAKFDQYDLVEPEKVANDLIDKYLSGFSFEDVLENERKERWALDDEEEFKDLINGINRVQRVQLDLADKIQDRLKSKLDANVTDYVHYITVKVEFLTELNAYLGNYNENPKDIVIKATAGKVSTYVSFGYIGEALAHSDKLIDNIAGSLFEEIVKAGIRK